MTISKVKNILTGKTFPSEVWLSCQGCEKPVYIPELVRNLKVCPYCQHHHRLTAQEVVGHLCDRFEGLTNPQSIHDPLEFKDTKTYVERLSRAKHSNDAEALLIGQATIGQQACTLACFDFSFIGGSMGVDVGERFVQACLHAISSQQALVCVTASGGARMQEGVFSLLQMAKVSAAIAQIKAAGLPYVVILMDPTTGGVSASLATLGDVIWAEPGALVGFTGPRVIAQTVKQTLPKGFQRSEFLWEHGLIDKVIARRDLKRSLEQLIGVLPGGNL